MELNKKISEYLDKTILREELLRKQIKTGGYIRRVCKNIERAIDEVYKTPAIVNPEFLESMSDAQAYYFSCIRNTPTTGGYFGIVYFHIEEDFYDEEKYETALELVFSETEPDTGAYDIWEDESTTVWIKVRPDGYDVEYTPINDPEHYPMITGDCERIKKFIEILKDDSWMTIPFIENERK